MEVYTNLGTVSTFANDNTPYANAYHTEASVAFTSSGKAAFSAQTTFVFSRLRVTSCSLEVKVSGSWQSAGSLTPPATESNNTTFDAQVNYGSSYTRGKTYRIIATFDADGHTIKHSARQHTTPSCDKDYRFRNGSLDFLYNTLAGQNSTKTVLAKRAWPLPSSRKRMDVLQGHFHCTTFSPACKCRSFVQECPNEYLKKIKERKGNSCRMTPRAVLFFLCAEAVIRLNKDSRNCPKVFQFPGKAPAAVRRCGNIMP